MPTYTRYIVEVETVVKVRTDEGRDVANFTVTASETANNDTRPVDKAIVNATRVASIDASRYADTIVRIETEKIR